jgi:tetratricopeptide (TPR) repeat protein
MDNFIKKTKTFKFETFTEFENTEVEKSVFYRMDYKESNTKNAKYVKEYIENFQNNLKIIGINKINKRESIFSSRLRICNWFPFSYYYWAGRWYYYQKDFKKSKKYLNKIISLKIPRNRQLRFLIAGVYNLLGNIERLKESADWKKMYYKVIKILKYFKNKNDKEFLILGKLFYTLGEFKEGERWLKKALKSEDKKITLTSLILLGDISKELGSLKWEYYYEKAEKLLSTEKGKDILTEKYNIASIMKRIGDYEISEKTFKQLLTMEEIKDKNTMISGIYFHLGEIEYFRGNFNKAKEFFKICLKKNPYHLKAKKYLEKIINNGEK